MEEGQTDRKVRWRVTATEVCTALNEEEAKYLVIGGIACILHGYVRATSDVDILIEKSPDNVRRVLDGLSRVGYGYAKDFSVEEILSKPITIIGDDPGIDIFWVAWSVKYDQALPRSLVAEVDGVRIPYVGLDDLIATKQTGRPLDQADVEALLEIKRLRGGDQSL